MIPYNCYVGPSMKPTLREGDILEIVPYRKRRIRVGDVVVFHEAGKNRDVVHRVVFINSGRIRTRGDNNISIDPCVLNPEHIIGRVISARRGKRNVKVFCGPMGRAIATGLWIAKLSKLLIHKMSHPVYQWLVQSGIFRNFLAYYFKTRILCFRRSNGIELQLLLGQRIIGRHFSGNSRWGISPPFRLLVDEVSLPRADNLPVELSRGVSEKNGK